MDRLSPSLHALAFALAIVSGYVDGLTFVTAGQFFASFMSGNSTRLGVGLVGDGGQAAMAAALIGSFVAGVVIAAIVAHAAGPARPRAVLVTVTMALAGAAVVPLASARPLLLAAAMGASNNVFVREGEVAVGVTYFTGTLVRAGQRLAGVLTGTHAAFAWVAPVILWIGLIVGVVAGVGAAGRMGIIAIWPAVILTAALALAPWRVRAT